MVKVIINRRKVKPIKCAILAVFAAALVSSCAGVTENQTEVDEQPVTAEMVLNSSPLAKGIMNEDVKQVDLLALSPEMTAFLDEHVDRNGKQTEKLAQLVYAIIGEDRFVLAFDDSTRTAQSTFQDRRGNCISFTNMFVAMARDLELDASYQEVTIPPDWSMTGQTFLFSQHVNALVGMKNALSRVVDFNTFNIGVPEDSREISDQRARAHYFNNIGVEHMLAGETRLAYANFRESLQEDQTFSSSWVNLGVLHRREAYPGYAEAAYLEALEYDKSSLMAMSNLANLYTEQGRIELAEHYLSKVKSHRMSNPFYRYELANAAIAEGDYKTAIRNLKYAIRKRKDQDQFYFLLSLSYLMSGEKETAQRWMEKAEEVALQSTSKKKYHHKLDLLMGRDTGF